MNTLSDVLAALEPYLPPAFGALLGLKWAPKQSAGEKAFSFVCGFGLAVYFGPMVSELMTLGPKSSIGAGILIAIVGMDVIGGFVAVSNQFRKDPLATFKSWTDVVIGAWKSWTGRGV